MKSLLTLLAAGWLSVGSVFAAELATESAPLEFNRDIRPILSDNCFACHGPDENTREADLRLDDRAAAIEDRGGYAAILPGDPAASLILERILTDDEDLVMPPRSAHKTLTDAQKETLRRWIAQGAPYQGHWAFDPVKDPVPPEVTLNAAPASSETSPPGVASNWCRNPIDQFVLQQLQAQNLSPSPEADRRTLIRRLSLDLTGILPTPAEVQAFVSDTRPDAYEQLVDRLLASPHYGERWGRHWLDQARYGDSNGYTIDRERVMWPYRDWVIQALNQDMPFDQFTIEQLAGDLLPNPTKQQLVATGFHRNAMINEEGGTDAEQFRNETVVDRTNTTGAVWLGLTFACAQCHSHKFDPISHEEYFSFFGFFNSTTDVNNRGETLSVLPSDLMPPPDVTPEELTLLSKLQHEASRIKNSAAGRQAAWEKAVAANPPKNPKWTNLEVDQVATVSNRIIRQLDDKSILVDREGSANDTYEISGRIPLKTLATVRLQVLPHESLAGEGAGTAPNGNFVLTEFELIVDGQEIPFAHAVADHFQEGYLPSAAIDGQKESGWALKMDAGGKGKHEIWFTLEQPIDVADKTVQIRMRHDRNDHYLVGRFQLFATDTAPQTHPRPFLWKQVLTALEVPAAERTRQQNNYLGRVFREIDLPSAKAEQIATQLDQVTGTPVSMMVMKELPQPRETFIHLRGDFLSPDQDTGPLKPDTPDCLPPLNAEQEMPNRLDLARWLVRSDNPLTPRVTVNRIWMQYFGQGLVLTEDDFGTQGSAPSHPELLDWLASRLIASGWSLKDLHRQIVTSATYRQASHFRPDLQEVDPRNTLLARQQRLRLDAEIIRDSALTASGLLNPNIGGPTVRPPQPDGVYAFTQTVKRWDTSTGADRYRRALYTQFIRSAPYPLFTTFDAPNFTVACTRRVRSNTPLQALTMANDTAFVEMAQALALRLLAEVPPAEDTSANSASADSTDCDLRRLNHGFMVCYGRPPTENERDLLLGFIEQQTAVLKDASPEEIGAIAPANLPEGLSATTAALWSTVARVLLNTDEFITRE